MLSPGSTRSHIKPIYIKNESPARSGLSFFDYCSLQKTKFYKKRFDELVKKYREETGDMAPINTKQRNEFYEIIDIEWNKHEEEREPLMPNKFKYKGVVIIISNDTRDMFKKEVGVGNWNAIVDRMRSFDLHPMAESIWAVIKKILLKERDESEEKLPSKMCMIPRDMIDEFIKEYRTNSNVVLYELTNTPKWSIYIDVPLSQLQDAQKLFLKDHSNLTADVKNIVL